MSRQGLAERTAQIAATARAVEQSHAATKAVQTGDTVEYLTPARHRWRVNRWGDDPLEVLVVPPQTQAQMRALYPEAAGILAP